MISIDMVSRYVIMMVLSLDTLDITVKSIGVLVTSPMANIARMNTDHTKRRL